MGTTTRRGFLKGLGATLSAIGVASGVPPALSTVGTSQGSQQADSSVLAHSPYVHPRGAGRSMITPDALEMLVVEQLTQWVAERQMFTAHDVTQALRAAHPAINIFHQPVRHVVHQRMWPALAAQIYVQEQVWFSTGSAYRYRPLL